MRQTPSTPRIPKLHPHPLPLAFSDPHWDLASPWTFKTHRLLLQPPPAPSPPPPCTHTHLIVIDSVFVPLCEAVASDEDTYTELRRCTHCTLRKKLQVCNLWSDRELHAVGESGHSREWQDGMGQGVCRIRNISGWAIQARLDQGVRALLAVGASWREAQCSAMCLRRPSLGFTPPQGWEPGHILSHGTKRGVCVWEGWGFKGGVLIGSRPWPLYIHLQITNLAHTHAHTTHSHTHTHTHACKHMLMCAYVHRPKCICKNK